MAIQHLSTRLIKPNFCFDLPHRRSITVSLELEIHFSSLVHFGLVSTPPHKILVTGLVNHSTVRQSVTWRTVFQPDNRSFNWYLCQSLRGGDTEILRTIGRSYSIFKIHHFLSFHIFFYLSSVFPITVWLSLSIHSDKGLTLETSAWSSLNLEI